MFNQFFVEVGRGGNLSTASCILKKISRDRLSIEVGFLDAKWLGTEEKNKRSTILSVNVHGMSHYNNFVWIFFFYFHFDFLSIFFILRSFDLFFSFLNISYDVSIARFTGNYTQPIPLTRHPFHAENSPLAIHLMPRHWIASMQEFASTWFRYWVKFHSGSNWKLCGRPCLNNLSSNFRWVMLLALRTRYGIPPCQFSDARRQNGCRRKS